MMSLSRQSIQEVNHCWLIWTGTAHEPVQVLRYIDLGKMAAHGEGERTMETGIIIYFAIAFIAAVIIVLAVMSNRSK